MKITSLTLYSSDLDRQEFLYLKRLGFSGERESDELLRVDCGANQLFFRFREKAFFYHYSFLIPTGSMESAIQHLDEAGFESLPYEGNRIVDFGNGRSVYFRDGDGNVAEFIERPTLDYPGKISFDVQDIIRLNEVGVPHERPVAFARQLMERFGIRPAEGAAFRDEFVWCGDYEGVLLIPRIGRAWIPTQTAAEMNDLEVEIEEGGSSHRLRFESNEVVSL